MVTDSQVRALRKARAEGKTQAEAARMAGMSTRTARKWEVGQLPSDTSKAREWRTRADPFSEVCLYCVRRFLDQHKHATAREVLAWVARRHPDRFNEQHLRTIQRRLKLWRRGAALPASDEADVEAPGLTRSR